MKSKIILFGAFLSAFILILVPSISCVNASDGKPDLKIIDIWGVTVGKGSAPGFEVTYTNEGDAPVSGGICREVNLTVKTLFLQIIKYKSNVGRTGGVFYPDELCYQKITAKGPTLGVYRCYFEIDPDNKIEESNENNNIAWAYFILINKYYYEPIRIGKVHMFE